jgi:hypothetical protein
MMGTQSGPRSGFKGLYATSATNLRAPLVRVRIPPNRSETAALRRLILALTNSGQICYENDSSEISGVRRSPV